MEREEERGDKGEEGRWGREEHVEEEPSRQRAVRTVGLSVQANCCPVQPCLQSEYLFPGERFSLRYIWERTHLWGSCTS